IKGSYQRKAELLAQLVKWYQEAKRHRIKVLIKKTPLYEFITLGTASYYGVLLNGRSEAE
ncbi:hypothetical protein WAI98_20240, partial [Acinetobacter baumannii]